MPELLLIMFFPVAPGLWQSSATPFEGTLEDCRAAAVVINDTSPTHWAVCADMRAVMSQGRPT